MTVLHDVTVVSVTYNSAHIIADTLQHLSGFVPVIIADNGSTDDTVSVLQTFGAAVSIVSLDHNSGFGRANNAALERVETPFALLLNPDAVISVEAIEALLAAARRYPEAAILAPLLYDTPGVLGECYRSAFYRPQPRGRIVPGGDLCSEFLTGAAMLLRMDVMREVGFFDPWFFLYLEDDDLCERARAAGHSLVLVHDATVLHRVRQSSTPRLGLDYLRAYCQAASKMYAMNKHVGPEAYHRQRRRILASAPVALLGALLTFDRRRAARAWGRLLAAIRAPRLLRQPHCIESA